MAGPASLPVTCPGLYNTTHPSVCATLLLQGREMKESVFPATSVVDAATTATSVQRLVWHVFCVETRATLRWFVEVAAHRRRPSSVTRGERRSRGQGSGRYFAARSFSRNVSSRGNDPVNIVGPSLVPEMLPSVPVEPAKQAARGVYRRDAFMADIKVNTTPHRLLVDTGSFVSILNEREFNEVQRSSDNRLCPPSKTLVHYMQDTIPVLGCFTAQVVFKDRYAPLEFFVTRTGRSLLGVDAVRVLRMRLSGDENDYVCSHVDAAQGGGVPQQYVKSAVPLQRRPFTITSCQNRQPAGSRDARSWSSSLFVPSGANVSTSSSVSEETTPKVPVDFDHDSSTAAIPRRHPEPWAPSTTSFSKHKS